MSATPPLPKRARSSPPAPDVFFVSHAGDDIVYGPFSSWVAACNFITDSNMDEELAFITRASFDNPADLSYHNKTAWAKELGDVHVLSVPLGAKDDDDGDGEISDDNARVTVWFPRLTRKRDRKILKGTTINYANMCNESVMYDGIMHIISEAVSKGTGRVMADNPELVREKLLVPSDLPEVDVIILDLYAKDEKKCWKPEYRLAKEKPATLESRS